MKKFNLKLRGLEENKEGTTAFISLWLASALEMEKGVAPIITQAFRKKYPRDIIITLGDMRMQNPILDTARNKGTLCFQDQQIAIFPDKASKAIAKKWTPKLLKS